MVEQTCCLSLVIKQLPSQQSAVSIELLLSSNRFDVTELAYHQQESPGLLLTLIWDVSKDRELIETSLRHLV